MRFGSAQLDFAQPPVHGNAGEKGIAFVADGRLPVHLLRNVCVSYGWTLYLSYSVCLYCIR